MKIFYPAGRVDSKILPFTLLLWIYESIESKIFLWQRMMLVPMAAVLTLAMNASACWDYGT